MIYHAPLHDFNGRFRRLDNDEYRNVLSQLTFFVRSLFQKILVDENYINQFEKEDINRKEFLLNNFIKNYSAPKVETA